MCGICCGAFKIDGRLTPEDVAGVEKMMAAQARRGPDGKNWEGRQVDRIGRVTQANGICWLELKRE